MGILPRVRPFNRFSVTGKRAKRAKSQYGNQTRKTPTGPLTRIRDHFMKKSLLLIALAFAVTVALPARAQGGCDDSPENPTLILAGLAGGAFAVSSVRTRIRA